MLVPPRSKRQGARVDAWMPPLLGGLVGLAVGSFVAALLLRWPQGRTLGGRSRCDGCSAALGAAELVPLLSFAAQRGRCRRCGARIDPRHPLLEAAGALVGAVALAVAPGWTGAAGALLGWFLLALGALDAEHRWLPDRLTLPLAALGLAFGLGAPGDRLIGLGAGFGSLWLIAWGYRRWRGREGLGGGDPKLFGALGAWLGWPALPPLLLAAAMLGLAAVLLARLRGERVAADDALPLGSLLAAAAFPLWCLMAA